MTESQSQEILQRGIALHRAGHLGEAEKIYRQILSRKPKHSGALHLLGVIAAQVGRNELAIELIRAAIAIDSRVADYHNDLGSALLAAKQPGPAVEAFRQSLALSRGNPKVLNNLGNALCDQGMLEEGIEAYRQALKIRPDLAGAQANLGKAWRDLGKIDDSIAACRAALRIQPDYAEAHHNLGLALLTIGDYEHGWPEHEWRLRLRRSTLIRRDITAPRWDGSALNGRTILLYAEQGMGDTIQFARYIPMVRQHGGKVVLQAQAPLCRLLKSVPGVDQIVLDGEPAPRCDVHCPLLSLPLVFGTRLDSIPAETPYISVVPEPASEWRNILAGSSGRKVGIVWAGAAGFSNDRNRSISLSMLAPLASATGVSFYSLQKGQASGQAASPPAGMDLIDHVAKLHDFVDTAALIENLDLVISVDTAVAHLAGAMNKAVWLMLPFAADWRWLRDRDDSPWYPSMRLFRQETAGNWPHVVARIAAELGQ